MPHNLPKLPAMDDIQDLLRFELNEGRIWMGEERMILLRSSELQGLRRLPVRQGDDAEYPVPKEPRREERHRHDDDAHEDPPADLFDGLDILQRNRAAMAIVRSPEGRYVGIVTLKDLVEEIVGELEAW